MKRKIIISNKEFTMPKMSIDTYTEYLDIAEQMDTHPRYTKQDSNPQRSHRVALLLRSSHHLLPYCLHKITFLEYIEYTSPEINLIRWPSDTKKDRSLSIFLENERSFMPLLFSWMMMILFSLWYVSEAAVQYDWDIHTIWNYFFVCFSITLVKPEKPLKVSEVEKFYKSVRCSTTIVSTWKDCCLWITIVKRNISMNLLTIGRGYR